MVGCPCGTNACTNERPFGCRNRQRCFRSVRRDSLGTQTQRVMRILLDTNIWVSAFLSPHGHCGSLVRRLIMDSDVELVTSLPLVDEIVDVLGRPRLARRYGFAPEEVKDYVTWIWSATQLVVPVAESYGCRDCDDDVVCGTAVAAGAQYLTTRDDD